MKKYPIQFQIVHQIEKRRWVLMVVLVAAIHLFCQTLMLPYGTALQSLLPGHNNSSYYTQMSNSDTLDDEFQEENLEFVKTRDFGDDFVDEDSETKQEILSVGLSEDLGDGISINSNSSNEEVKPKIVKVNAVNFFNESGVNTSRNGLQLQILPINEKYALFQSDGTKKMRCLMPPKSVMYIDQMERLLARNRRSSRAMV